MGSWYAENDGTWPDEQAVEVRYPLTEWQRPEGMSADETLAAQKAERETWPWLPGEIAGQCGPDEWEVMVNAPELAQLEDGSPAPDGTAEEDLFFPTCYRDGSEIREPQREAEAAKAKRRLCAHADHDGEGMHWLEPGEKCSWPPAPPATVTDIRSCQRRADREAGQ
jgi:hypothetical protein